MAVKSVMCKEDHNLTYLSSSIITMTNGQSLTSAINTVRDQINVLNREINRNKSFAWRHSKRKRRRYW